LDSAGHILVNSTEGYTSDTHQGEPAGRNPSWLSRQDGEGDSTDLKRAADFCKLAADQGVAAPQTNYGFCLQTGKCVSFNFQGGAHYFKLAADQGDAAVQNGSGFCRQTGKGVSIDFQ
jgi:TPR repeat protein